MISRPLSIAVAGLFFIAAPSLAQNTLPAATVASIARAVNDLLATTGAPSASIAVVTNGAVTHVGAYGFAKTDPPTRATSDMRYSIGSISKQFTSAAILLLAEDGQLSLDDHVSRWFPALTRANEVTIRHLLSMTSGYQDFWPQDYVMPGMKKDVAPDEILRSWAHKPLDFDPGTKWQYSNTNYVVAGLIAERVSGQALVDFLRERVFRPLRMTSVVNTDEAALSDSDPMRYMRFGLGHPRPAPKEGRGWMFGAGELAMTARDLALWDIAMMNQTVLKPSSYVELQRTTLLLNGAPTAYGLGVSIAMVNNRRMISHSGEVSGFTARNNVYPDERAAVVVMVNLDATDASSTIASRIADILFASTDPASVIEQARRIFDDLQHGRIDRSIFTDNANAYFNEQAVKDFEESLKPLGRPDAFTQTSRLLRGGMIARRFEIKFPKTTLHVTTFTLPDGKIEQYMVAAAQ
jgi:CubicO group peptidase (beta-lactamase class C family)